MFLGLGSNLGDRLECLRQAVERLRRLPAVQFLDASPLYQTEPWEANPGEAADPEASFFNCVVAIETSVPPRALLDELQGIERALGRVRVAGTPEDGRYERRTLDIDILGYGDKVISATAELSIPHLLMHERAFVLRPLADLAPDWEHPTLYRTAEALLAGLSDEHEVQMTSLPRRWFER
ncbi:MAG: 2-amino-4-hydroxy-6-hydroxymethyldihydropteridine diphosphokinase [Candidatus Rokubacteria bacterium]|nr:2-amino-4-hydroxy-6-hydroxymethyldihydropteridine diphosphokinase [Candidatus Rokubacteria bacterium]